MKQDYPATNGYYIHTAYTLYFLQKQMLSYAIGFFTILSKHYSLHDSKLIVFKEDLRDEIELKNRLQLAKVFSTKLPAFLIC